MLGTKNRIKILGKPKNRTKNFLEPQNCKPQPSLCHLGCWSNLWKVEDYMKLDIFYLEEDLLL